MRVFLVENLSVMLQVGWFRHTKRKYREGEDLQDVTAPPLTGSWASTRARSSRFWIAGIHVRRAVHRHPKLQMAAHHTRGEGERHGAALLMKRRGLEGVRQRCRPTGRGTTDCRKQEDRLRGGRHTLERVLDTDELLKSPGIPREAAVVRAAREGGPSDRETSSPTLYQRTGRRHHRQQRKTTTAAATHHILTRPVSMRAWAAAWAQLGGPVADRDHAWWALELSSFQLDDVMTSKPHIAIAAQHHP